MGINSEEWKWNEVVTSTLSNDLPHNGMLIEIQPGLFQLDFLAINRFKLLRGESSTNEPRWPSNRRRSTLQTDDKKVEVTTQVVATTVQELNDDMDANNLNATQLQINANEIDRNTTYAEVLTSIKRNNTTLHYEVTTESEDVAFEKEKGDQRTQTNN